MSNEFSAKPRQFHWGSQGCINDWWALSNHVPELHAIVKSVGLGPFIDEVISSANVGFEKPHPAIFALARELAGNPKEVWMVGDNQQADVEGSRAAGIPAILVQHPDRPSTPGALSLLQAERIICEWQNRVPKPIPRVGFYPN